MIGEIRKFIREQRRVEKDRRMKDEQEEMRRRWEKDGEIWEPAGRKTGKETAEDARGDEAAVVEETEKGGKGVGNVQRMVLADGATVAGRGSRARGRRSGGSKRRLSRRRRGSNGNKKKQQGSNDSSRRKKCGGSKSIRKRRPGEKANEGDRGSRTR